ncbi:amidohydrolase 2 [Hypoxylon sp. NC1633]|nr:amidohydrolase 2 [Hypoxylon sp. NC1633]
MAPPSFAITLEEHAAFPALVVNRPEFNGTWQAFPWAKNGLQDYSTGRLADMDENHISYQIISHVPGMGNGTPDGCQKANDEMAEAIKKNPSRFGGFATLPMAYPEKAAEELERAVKELGFFGALIGSHLEDMTHYDDERFWPVFEAAERLDVPLYIHPAPPSADFVKQVYGGNYSDAVMQGLSTAVWGWHQDVGLHILKLHCAGMFQRFPKVKIIIGHMGELLPIMMDRVHFLKFYQKEGLGDFNEVWNRNIWVTSSGIFSVRTLDMILKVTNKDRILYSVDHPFSKNSEGWKFIQELAESGLLSKEEQDMFAYGNAKKLFKMDVALKEF